MCHLVIGQILSKRYLDKCPSTYSNTDIMQPRSIFTPNSNTTYCVVVPSGSWAGQDLVAGLGQCLDLVKLQTVGGHLRTLVRLILILFLPCPLMINGSVKTYNI